MRALFVCEQAFAALPRAMWWRRDGLMSDEPRRLTLVGGQIAVFGAGLWLRRVRGDVRDTCGLDLHTNPLYHAKLEVHRPYTRPYAHR